MGAPVNEDVGVCTTGIMGTDEGAVLVRNSRYVIVPRVDHRSDVCPGAYPFLLLSLFHLTAKSHLVPL